MNENKSKARILLGAAFLMAISAVGPGFLVQTARFTEDHGANHGFIILISLILALGVQLNVWRVIGASGMRGQDIANKLVPGLGYFVAFLIVLGGFAFNIGNVGGAALGLSAMAGIPLEFGYWIAGLLAVVIFISKNTRSIVDWVMKILGVLMIGIVFVVMFITQPPVGEAAARTVLPQFQDGLMAAFFPIMTYLGGTVGGYITFSGAHRLLDAGIKGKENIKLITASSVQGVSIAALMRVILFLAILGVIAAGYNLNPVEGFPANPAAIAFYHGAGIIGYRFFGVVLLIAGLTSVIGAAYTSISFLKTLFKPVGNHERLCTIILILISTAVMSFLGSPANLLVLVGFLNSLILPVTLSVILLASRRRDIVGEDYKHPTWMIIMGIIIVGLTLFISIRAFPSMIANLFG